MPYRNLSKICQCHMYMAQMNLSTEKKVMDLENRLVVAKGEGEGVGVGWIGNLGLID